MAGQPWTPNAPTELSAGGASMPVLAQPPKRRSRKLIAAISAACLLALLVAATAYLYNTFAAQAQVGAARYLPGNTVAYGSIDLIAAATNGYHYDPRKLDTGTGGTSVDQIQKATGLNWQSDVLPWLGREIAVGVFPKPGAATGGTALMNPGDQFGTAFLLQSRDDGKAQAAVAKAASFQKQQGHSVSQANYGGLTVYAVQYSSGSGGSAFVAGKGWAIIANDADAAHAVIDRLNGASGSNGTLAESAAFQTATKDLPSGRFGTLFVNVKALVLATMPQGSQTTIPFFNLYPTAGGYLSWTSQGLRAQMTLVASGTTAVGNLGGDTTSLASLIPAHPVSYVGIANLGAALQESAALTGSGAAGATADLAQSLFGVPATDPSLQQPAAVAVGAANGVPSVEFALKAPDSAAAQSLLRSAAKAHDWTLKPATIAGEQVTAIYGTPGSLFDMAPMVASSMAGTSSSAVLMGDGQPELVGYAGMMKGSVVFTSTADDFTSITQTAQGAQPALATQNTFQSLVRQAPQGAASTVFVDLSSFGALMRGSTASSGMSAQATALLLTGVWNAQEVQTTLDVQLQQ